MAIELFKLISGEEIIGSVESETDGAIAITDTVTITYHPQEGGRMTAGFAPQMPYSDGKITLYTSAVAMRAGVKSEMLEEYKRIFSKIITPHNGLIGL